MRPDRRVQVRRCDRSPICVNEERILEGRAAGSAPRNLRRVKVNGRPRVWFARMQTLLSNICIKCGLCVPLKNRRTCAATDLAPAVLRCHLPPALSVPPAPCPQCSTYSQRALSASPDHRQEAPVAAASSAHEVKMERREGSSSTPEGGQTFLKEVKKSYSFGGYGLLPGLSQQEELSLEEVKLLFGGSPKEPSRSTKERIKLLASKYRDVECVGAGEAPWYEELAQQINVAPLLMVALTVLIAVRLCPVPWHVSERYTAHAHATYTVLVSASFGTECWMTFFSGVALFFSVPRHVFAQVQIVLFPLYFLVKAALLLLALICFLLARPFLPSSTGTLVQSSLLTLAFLTNLLVRLYLAPHLTRLIAIKMAIEKEEGLGGEVGSTAPGRLKHCPHYMKLHRAFRRVHSTIAVANMLSLTCSALLVSYQGLQR